MNSVSFFRCCFGWNDFFLFLCILNMFVWFYSLFLCLYWCDFCVCQCCIIVYGLSLFFFPFSFACMWSHSKNFFISTNISAFVFVCIGLFRFANARCAFAYNSIYIYISVKMALFVCWCVTSAAHRKKINHGWKWCACMNMIQSMYCVLFSVFCMCVFLSQYLKTCLLCSLSALTLQYDCVDVCFVHLVDFHLPMWVDCVWSLSMHICAYACQDFWPTNNPDQNKVKYIHLNEISNTELLSIHTTANAINDHSFRHLQSNDQVAIILTAIS